MQQTPSTSQPQPQVKVIPGRPVLLDCPKCNHFVSSGDIDLTSETAHCANCHHSFPFDDQLKADPHRRPEMIMPQSIESLKLGSMLEIVVDWYQSAPKKTVSSLVAGSFFWNVLIWPIVIFLALRAHFFLMIVLGGHLLTGLYLIRQLLATFLNKSTITVDQHGIEIKHGPIPTSQTKKRLIDRNDIEQLYVLRYTHKYHEKDRRGVQAYALYVILKDGSRVELLRGMDRQSQLYIEQEIETYLRIEDVPIEGEVPRKE